MKVVGYCRIRKNPTTGVGPELNTFAGTTVRVMEFDNWGGVLAVNPQGTAMAMFERDDIETSFKCTTVGDVLMPPNLNEFEQLLYHGKVLCRKGGYNSLLKQMVIEASLHRGQFNDQFLFQKQ